MVKSKPSMTGSSRTPEGDALRAVDEAISELSSHVNSVVDSAKGGIWEMYGNLLEDGDKERLRELLDEYEPSVTESEVASLVYGNDGTLYYQEAMEPLLEALDGEDVDSFFVSWSVLRNLNEERRRLLAGQMVIRLGL